MTRIGSMTRLSRDRKSIATPIQQEKIDKNIILYANHFKMLLLWKLKLGETWNLHLFIFFLYQVFIELRPQQLPSSASWKWPKAHPPPPPGNVQWHTSVATDPIWDTNCDGKSPASIVKLNASMGHVQLLWKKLPEATSDRPIWLDIPPLINLSSHFLYIFSVAISNHYAWICTDLRAIFWPISWITDSTRIQPV